MKVVVAGGGWAGCASAYFASKAGAEVILVEKTDLLLGTGLVGGIMRNNGRYSATEEAIALGGGDIFRVIESVARHRDINFPGHSHALLYDVQRIERIVRRCLEEQRVKIVFRTLIKGAAVHDRGIEHVVTSTDEVIPGDVFIDATGTAGPINNCIKYGTGCAMCILRCPSFGSRVSLTALAGVKEIKAGEGTHQFEAMSGSCKLDKKSLSKSLVKELDRNGVVIIPLPEQYHKKVPCAERPASNIPWKNMLQT